MCSFAAAKELPFVGTPGLLEALDFFAEAGENNRAPITLNLLV